MRVGEKSLIHVGAQYAYGSKGAHSLPRAWLIECRTAAESGTTAAGNFSFPSVPPDADLEYEAELISFEPVDEVCSPSLLELR